MTSGVIDIAILGNTQDLTHRLLKANQHLTLRWIPPIETAQMLGSFFNTCFSDFPRYQPVHESATMTDS